MNSLEQIIGKIINEWDPIELFPFSPKDEYKDEILLITKLVENTKNKTEIANGVQRIFLEFFGEPEFSDKRYDESMMIAGKILKEIVDIGKS